MAPVPLGPTGGCVRVLQVHPTRQCNLRCLHCYSVSGPDLRSHLSAGLLCDAISAARTHGYSLLGVSGGEPLLYQGLSIILHHARRLGMQTTVTTNGMLLTRERARRLVGDVDLIAISIDGIPDSHNRIRANTRAFEVMSQNLEHIRAAGIPFGFIFTLTMFNVHELRWVANFAVTQGASLLQVHPLEEAGRAAQMMEGSSPDRFELAAAYMECLAIQAAFGDQIHVHIDVADADLLRAEPARVFAQDLSSDWQEQPLSDLVNPLIIEADGVVVPIQHGLSRTLALGSLLRSSFANLASEWIDGRYLDFHAVCRTAWLKATAHAEIPLVNWYELLQREADMRRPATKTKQAG